MSLKWFHIVFISLSVLLSLWFGVWGLFNQQIALGIVSLGASAGLVLYGNYFLGKAAKTRRMKIALATIVMLAIPETRAGVPGVFRQRRFGANQSGAGGHPRVARGDGRHARVDCGVLFHLPAAAHQDGRRVERRELLDA